MGKYVNSKESYKSLSEVLANSGIDTCNLEKPDHALEHPERVIDIALVGKYVDLRESYKSLSEALIHAGIYTRSKINIHYTDFHASWRTGVPAEGRLAGPPDLWRRGKVIERHRHRYEVNNQYIPTLEEAGLRINPVSAGEGLCEMVKLPQTEHPWFVACQLHPEFTSTPKTGHPLFSAFIEAAIDYAKKRATAEASSEAASFGKLKNIV